MEPLFDELQCPVCLELYNCPVILPCSHILCRSPCAERLINHGFVRCPVCRDNSYISEGVQTLPRVISLENIINRLKHPRTDADVCRPGDVPCQLCQQTPRRATKSCTDCNASYCVHCLVLSHPDKEPFIQHHLVEPVLLKRPVELKCRQHDELVNIYCKDCCQLGCVLCVDNDGLHPGHRILSLEQAAAFFKDKMEANLKILEDQQEAKKGFIRLQQGQLGDFQVAIDAQRRQIREQCESLIAEVHTKMELFLSDLEYEEKSRSGSLAQRIDICRQHTVNMSSLTQYTRDVLKEDEQNAFLQLALAADERVKVLLTETKDERLQSPTGAAASIHNKVVDFRKEQAILRDMSYLEAPHTPVIDVAKCSRSKNSVVLVLSPPLPENDVIDGYKVYYCSEAQKAAGEQQMMIFKTPGEERKYGRGMPSCSAVCLIQENLDSGIMYFFCTRAYNLAGESEMSEIINCTTLSEELSNMPAPEIVVSASRTYSCSIQIHSPSPLAANPALTFYLLYREASDNKIWKSLALYNRADHRVFGLDPDTMYDFVIMLCDSNGECQVSNMVTLRTEMSAY
ncbi:E3 ubiquitin-protein ligase Midline-1 [Lamellibrachia satsuma]|nr:E3 ubiquitin-protein ligase Midline-1 [Lamellibrachia satsuma]